MTTAREVDESFTDFVTEARPRLARIAYLMCGDWHHAEDVVQTVLGRLYRRWEKVSRAGDPQGYVRRALLNAVIDSRRRGWRREHPAGHITEESGGSPIYPVHASDPTTKAVLHALAQLAPRQRAVVLLRYVEQMSVTEVATELGISEGTVKSQASRGTNTLRALLSMPPPTRSDLEVCEPKGRE
jgi:RNA polymerase sigma-70 factor (sigma-E family)